MIKTVNTPSGLVKKRRLHCSNTDYFTMARTIGKESTGSLNWRDAVTKQKETQLLRKKDFDVAKAINIHNVTSKFNIGEYIKKALLLWYYSRGIK